MRCEFSVLGTTTERNGLQDNQRKQHRLQKLKLSENLSENPKKKKFSIKKKNNKLNFSLNLMEM